MKKVTITFAVMQYYKTTVDVGDDFGQVDWGSVICDAGETLPEYAQDGNFINATVLDENGVDIAEEDY